MTLYSKCINSKNTNPLHISAECLKLRLNSILIIYIYVKLVINSPFVYVCIVEKILLIFDQL